MKSDMLNLKNTRFGSFGTVSSALFIGVCVGFIALMLAGCDTNSSPTPGLPSTSEGTTVQAPLQPTQPTAGQKTSSALRSPSPQTASSGTISNWCDNFASGQIDSSKWQSSSDPNLIYQANGVLNFAVTAEQSSGQGVDASIQPVPTNQNVKDISFAITLDSVSGNVPGGAGVEIFQADGRDSSVYIGPGGDTGPDLEFSICRTTKCSGQEDEYDHPDGGDFPVGARTPIRIVWTGGKIQFYVNGTLRAENSKDPSPIHTFQFSLSSEQGSVFHIMVDDVCVDYTSS